MHNRTYVATTARCNVYKANIKLQSMNRLSTDFRHAVEALPLDDYAPYLHFISIYGTHYLGSVIMGAKAVVRSEFETSSYDALKKKKFDFSGGAQASFWIFHFKIDVKVCLHRGSFRGGTRGNAVPIVKVFKNALWTALQTIFRPKIRLQKCRILHIQNFSGGDTPDPRNKGGDSLPNAPPERAVRGCSGAQEPPCLDPDKTTISAWISSVSIVLMFLVNF